MSAPENGNNFHDPAHPAGPDHLHAVRDPKEERPREGVVLDLSGLESLDVQTLSLLLTAQQAAAAEDRTVWIAGLPPHAWRALVAMGLGGLFHFFPGGEGPRA